MKNIIVAYEEVKLEALRFYLESKGSTSIEEVLADQMESLYKKFVPNDVRNYLNRQLELESNKTSTQEKGLVTKSKNQGSKKSLTSNSNSINELTEKLSESKIEKPNLENSTKSDIEEKPAF